MHIKNYLIIISVIIFSCGYLYAEGENIPGKDTAAEEKESVFIYKSKGKRDPFVPLIDKDGKLIVSSGIINSINDIILEGILYDPNGSSIVVLNGLVLQENDKAGNIKVKKIEQDRVILLFEDEEHTLKLKE